MFDSIRRVLVLSYALHLSLPHMLITLCYMPSTLPCIMPTSFVLFVSFYAILSQCVMSDESFC